MKAVKGSYGEYKVRIYIGSIFEEYYEYDSGGSFRGYQDEIMIMDNQSKIASKWIGTAYGDTSPSIKYIFPDHLGSSNTMCDDTGSFYNREEYYPFGETSFGSYGKKRFRYCGKERDEESGMYYYGARYYLSWTCRFVSVDPKSYLFPWSSFVYAANDPIGLNDFNGESPEGGGDKDKKSTNTKNNPQGGAETGHGTREEQFRGFHGLILSIRVGIAKLFGQQYVKINIHYIYESDGSITRERYKRGVGFPVNEQIITSNEYQTKFPSGGGNNYADSLEAEEEKKKMPIAIKIDKIKIESTVDSQLVNFDLVKIPVDPKIPYTPPPFKPPSSTVGGLPGGIPPSPKMHGIMTYDGLSNIDFQNWMQEMSNYLKKYPSLKVEIQMGGMATPTGGTINWNTVTSDSFRGYTVQQAFDKRVSGLMTMFRMYGIPNSRISKITKLPPTNPINQFNIK